MTDQRQIDVSTLRDGDIVRAKRGEHGVVEGAFHPFAINNGWGIGSEAEADGLFAWNDKGWTITDVLRPVLVKGDRVRHQPYGNRVLIVIDVINSDLVMVVPEENRYIASWDVRTADLTRLPAAPEPAPIEVGDWLKSLMDKDSHVVTSVDGDWIGIRWWQSGAIYRVNRRSIEGWTRLDGPPEPPQGTVYVIGKTVWHADDWGHIAAAAGAVALEWSTVCGLYDTERLATLQIVHTLGVK